MLRPYKLYYVKVKACHVRMYVCVLWGAEKKSICLAYRDLKSLFEVFFVTFDTVCLNSILSHE